MSAAYESFSEADESPDEAALVPESWSTEEMKWTEKDPSRAIPRVPPGRAFKSDVGRALPPRPATKKTTRMAFSTVFPNSLLRTIVTHTNRWGKTNDWTRSKWKPTTVEEVETLLGLHVAMSIVTLPALEDYWLRGDAGGLQYPDFSAHMLITRYKQLVRALHFNDHTREEHWSTDNADKLHKLRPVIEAFGIAWAAAFVLGEKVSVDEAMIGFKGRSYFRQYLPKKITKWGFKVPTLCAYFFCLGSYCLKLL